MSNKQSNIEEIKFVARAFLYQDINETPYSPIVVIHPIFESGFASIIKNGEMQMVNIMDSEEDLEYARKEYLRRIKQQDSVHGIYSIIRKSYRLTFLKFIKTYLSKKDFSELLADAWVSSENPNQDINVPLKTAISWFRQADKKVLMSEDEYKFYNSLPEIITVYRGVAVGRNPKGLSWTCNKATAEWFANRYNTETKRGYIQSVDVAKNCILAYFNSRNEDELVVDTTMIEGRIKYDT